MYILKKKKVFLLRKTNILFGWYYRVMFKLINKLLDSILLPCLKVVKDPSLYFFIIYLHLIPTSILFSNKFNINRIEYKLCF